MAAEIIVHGEEATAAALKGLEGDLKDLTPTNRAAGEELLRAIQSLAPRVSGRLAGSFTVTATREAAKVESGLVYAPVIEYGWAQHGIEPQHYAERALAASTTAVEGRYRSGVERAVQKAQR